MEKKKFSPMNLSTSFAHKNGEKIVEGKSKKKLKWNLIMNVRGASEARACTAQNAEQILQRDESIDYRYLRDGGGASVGGFYFIFCFSFAIRLCLTSNQFIVICCARVVECNFILFYFCESQM